MTSIKGAGQLPDLMCELHWTVVRNLYINIVYTGDKGGEDDEGGMGHQYNFLDFHNAFVEILVATILWHSLGGQEV